MPSYFDLLKYARTGLASPDMTYYDKMRASTLMGGVVKTLTEQPPLSFKSDGSPLISWSMKGNGSQSGTPTPDNPVMPTFCGEKTWNLFDGSGIATSTNGVYVDSAGQMLYFHGKASVSGGRLKPLSNDITLDAGTYRIKAFGQESIQLFLQKKGDSTTYYRFDNSLPIIRLEERTTFFISCGVEEGAVYGELVGIVLVSGSVTPTSYIPYGWQIPITCAGQTVPVYLGEVPTVRRIRKLVLDGTENVELNTVDRNRLIIQAVYTLTQTGTTTATNIMCSHLKTLMSGSATSLEQGITMRYNGTDILFGVPFSLVGATTEDSNATIRTKVKSYIAAQYAAGNPVTVWYVLAEPETGIVNEPLAKIGDYADELHSEDAGVTIPTVKGSNTLTVDTTVQPSEISITGNIKPES